MPRPDTTKAGKDATDSTESPADYHYAELTEANATDAVTLADECALAISYNGINHAVMMVSPSFVEDFIAGFSLSNSLVNGIEEIYDIQLERSGDALTAQVTLSNRAFWALKDHRRQLAGTSGCGLCGVEALDQALPALAPLPASPLPPAEHLLELRQRISAQQQLARSSGALHAALMVDADGAIKLCREDIGRHNALDKLIGALAHRSLDPQRGFAVITSRCSLELIQKAIRAGISTLVSLSAPTALSVQWARRHNLNLIHLPHHSSPRVFSPAPTRAPNR
ncbi:formate dehydrogenase accessory sulfurtransferase FdhD [Pseudomonas sp. EL_65y_Pfl2_R95]|uniref:formate dehydrogenase accessory sulfurtransferase FdhD n=1 Tax=Pseudomonas sp. EL_65y_Pfl2_R95 TaxID=3088698 RepID=UPI0030D85B4B